jgi:CelD/BcsL family acetyltransferase involved in cellulose biosynthesis
MYESRIAAGQLTVTASEGLAPEIDVLAARNLAGHAFLRARWYGASCGGTSEDGLRTLVLRAGDGTPLAALPTTAFGPAIAGLRKVPGCYWPLRSPLIAPQCTVFELAQALDHPAARSLGPVWRVGPVRGEDAATGLLVAAAQLAGWTVLSRPAGTSWVIDLDAARREGWPRRSTEKRLARAERRLAGMGPTGWRIVRGADWSDAVLDTLGAVEAASWIAAETDGSGAKFMSPQQRAAWRSVLADPVLADMLSATLLTVGGRAVAFSFDLDDGPVRYGIAGSYIREFASHAVGKLANHRAVADAIAAGRQVYDLGAGDSGYKVAMGAQPGYALADLLFVRSRTAARAIAPLWGKALAPADGRKAAR